MERPDVIVGTVSRVLAHVEAGHVTLRDSLEILVIDEADLIFSFGYEADLKKLIKYGHLNFETRLYFSCCSSAFCSHLPKICQSILMSATLSDDVTALKKLVLHNPVSKNKNM